MITSRIDRRPPCGQCCASAFAEKKRDLIPLDEAISTTDEVVGLMLTHMSGMAARCSGHDLQLRRRIEQVVYETRVAMSEAASKLADQRGEPFGRQGMTDAEVAAQIARADAFIAEFRELIAARNRRSGQLPARTWGLAATLDAVPYVTMCNLANINTAMRGMLLELIEVRLMCVGAGPTLDDPDAAALLATFQPVIDMALARRVSTDGG